MPDSTLRDTVYVVLLNYRGADDTIDCLDSLFASQDVSFRVIVCDNASGDGSLEHIASWAEGHGHSRRPDSPRLARLLGKAQRPLRVQQLERSAAEAGVSCATSDLILVDNGANLGFAAGNNVGLRLALAQPDMTHAWVLNNDTLVEPDCLSAMVQTLTEHRNRAVCGSVIHFFDQPEIIQALGGNRFNRLTGIAARSEGRFQVESDVFCPKETARRIDYVSGCSMLLPRAFLEEVGLMEEDFFLYYEEIDWFMRAGDRFPPCIAEHAHLYHREGRSIGSPGWQRRASAFADYHLYRSRMLFMRKHFAGRIPVVFLGALLEAVKCLLRGQGDNLQAMVRALFRPHPVRRPES